MDADLLPLAVVGLLMDPLDTSLDDLLWLAELSVQPLALSHGDSPPQQLPVELDYEEPKRIRGDHHLQRE